MKYRVKNWDHFQHYRDRNPPWIKLHYELLSSSDWVMLDDASRVLAIACMLIASRNKGEIDGSESGLTYLKRVAYLNKPPNLKALILCGFLVPASGLQADASTMQADAISEAYKERHIKKEETDNSFSLFWKTYPNKKEKGDAEKAWKSLRPNQELQQVILSAIEAAKLSHKWREEGGKFIPYPAKWLRRKRWEDEVSSPDNDFFPFPVDDEVSHDH